MINIYKNLIPLYFTINTRLRGKTKIIGYFLTYVIPVCILYFFKNEFKVERIIMLLISFLITMSIYEVGYLENDIKTVKKEKNPTLRLGDEERKKIDKNFFRLVFFKYLISLSGIYLLYLMGYKVKDMGISLGLIQLLYLLHNRIRTKANLLTFTLLSTLRYLSPLLIDPLNKEYYLINIFFMISLLRFFEKASEKKYNIKILEGYRKYIDRNRVVYYTVLLFFTKDNTLIVYYLIYRIICYVIIKRKR